MSFILSEDVEKGDIVIAILQSSEYKKKQMELTQQLVQKYKTLCYVNISRQFPDLLKDLKKCEICEDNIFFIDAITETKQEHDQCVFVGSPHGLTTISIALNKSLAKGKFEAVIFDSLSCLTNYHKPNTLTRFTHDLFAKLKKSGAVSVFTVQKGMDENFLADLSMFADHTIEVP
jgi:hypothetical protein